MVLYIILSFSGLYRVVFPDQSKCISRLVYGRTGIIEKIPVDSFNLVFNFWIAHLKFSEKTTGSNSSSWYI